MATIAEVLHYAADYCLWAGPGNNPKDFERIYSCAAIYQAAHGHNHLSDPIISGLREMGVKPEGYFEFEDVKDPQGARYMWLKFAALIAEEQGV